MYTKNEIFLALEEMGAPRDGIVLMHSAYSLVGEVEGGARGFLDALIDYFTSEGGLLCVPTHTWGRLGETELLFDMTEKYTNLGLLPRLALSDGRGVRTENPTHSMVVFGERGRAESFAECEKSTLTPTSPSGCYAKLARNGGCVLLVGVSHTKNTFLHAVDELLGTPNRMEKAPMRLLVKKANGEIIPREFYMFDENYAGDLSHKFDKFEIPFRYHGLIRDGRLGDAPTMLCDAVGMKDVVEKIYSRSDGADPLLTDDPLPPRFFVKR